MLLKSDRPADVSTTLKAEEYTQLLEDLGNGVMARGPVARAPDDDAIHSENEGMAHDSDFEHVKVRVRSKKRKSDDTLRSDISSAGSASGGDGSENTVSSREPSPERHDPVEPARDASESPLKSDGEDGMPKLHLPLVFDGKTFKSAVSFEKNGVVLECSREHHGVCKRFRGLGANQTAKYGEWESIAFFNCMGAYRRRCGATSDPQS